jgi:HPt (histidine-containing phosphotransfer) domain-containing protein
MSKLRVLVIHNNAAELDRISGLLEKGGYSVLPLENMTEASEALELQRFDAVLLPEDTPGEELAVFASKLRALEKNSRSETRTSILEYSIGITETKSPPPGGAETGLIDALLPAHFEPSLLATTVEQLSVRLSQDAANPAANEPEELAVFEPEAFSELLGHSRELLDEIIGLFLNECGSELQQMQDCLSRQDFNSLGKIAHTLKGSLGTLHAHRARARTQALEIAATRRTQEECESNLDRLKADLEQLSPLLIRMRSEL